MTKDQALNIITVPTIALLGVIFHFLVKATQKWPDTMIFLVSANKENLQNEYLFAAFVLIVNTFCTLFLLYVIVVGLTGIFKGVKSILKFITE